MQAGGGDSWRRTDWEAVIFRRPGSHNTQAGVYVPKGDVVIFTSFSDIKTIFTPAILFLSITHGAVDDTTIVVENKTRKLIDVFVSKWSPVLGSDSWYMLRPGAKLSWIRSFWEIVVFRDPNDYGKRIGIHVPNGTHVVFDGFNASWNSVETVKAPSAACPPTEPDPLLTLKPPPAYSPAKPQRPIVVENRSSGSIGVFVSNYTIGGESYTWAILGPGESITRLRTSWEFVAFKDPNADDTRAGIYVPSEAQVIFRNFADIEMKMGEKVEVS